MEKGKNVSVAKKTEKKINWRINHFDLIRKKISSDIFQSFFEQCEIFQFLNRVQKFLFLICFGNTHLVIIKFNSVDCIFSGNQLYPGLDPVFKLVSKRNTTQVNQDQTLSLIYSTIEEAIFVNYPHLSSFSFLNFIHWINHSFVYSYWECLGSCTISNAMIELAGVLGWLFHSI